RLIDPQALEIAATLTIFHPSGRPWILGRWEGDETPLVFRTREALFVLVGCPPASHTPVESLLQRVSGIADLNELAASLPGSFHLLASVGGQVRVQGSASGLRRVFHTRVEDVDVASDQANILACLIRSGIDPQRLSLRLLYPALPHPLGLHTPWQDIIPLPEDCYLRMPSAGAAHPVHWWMPPNPVASLAEGADRVR